MTRPFARHAATDVGRRRGLRRILVSGLAVAAAAAIVAGFALVARLDANLTVAPLQASNESGALAPSIDAETDPIDILILGSDGRDAGDGAFGEDDGTKRSDSMMLVHIADGNERIDAVQIPRDTLIDMPACEDVGYGSFAGGYGMINSAYNYGEGCAVRAVEALSGVDIDHVISMNFDGFATVVDAIGGITVCLAEPLRDGHSLLDLQAGEQTLGGEDALALARVRYVIGDGSDISRMANQQMVMSAIVQRATDAEVLSRPDRLYNMLDAVTSSLTVDPAIASISRLGALALRVNDVPREAITFITMPWAAAPSDPNRLVPAPDADRLWAAIAEDRPFDIAGREGDDPAQGATPPESEAAQAESAPETPATDEADPDPYGPATEEHDASEQIDAVARTADEAVCG